MEPDHKIWKLPFGYSFHIHHLGDYMRRWWISKPDGSSIRIHNILRSDDDPFMHDHPFSFTSIILWGSYTEVMSGSPTDHRLSHASFLERKLFSVAKRPAAIPHLIWVDKPVWTLVFAEPKEREWGFLTSDGWIHHSQYLNTNTRLTACVQ